MKMLAKLAARLLGLALALAAAACCLLAAQGYRMYRGALETRSLEETVAAVRAEPGYTAIDQLPQLYLDAVVAVEDHRFAQHGGVDPIAILRAAVHDLRTRSLDQGGSTITQQVAKNLFFTQEKQFARKIAEMFMAFRLEAAYTKEEILELYVNTIYFGDGYYGIRDACAGYFGKEPAALTPYEATLLAGIPNAPSVYSLTANPGLAARRQRYVVGQMVKYGRLTADEAAAITAP